VVYKAEDTKILSWQTSFNDYYQPAAGEEGE